MSVKQPKSTKQIYLDHAAATPVDAEVFESMRQYFSGNFYNASSIYLRSKSIRQVVESCRQEVARKLGTKPTEIIFTSGASESNNLAINGIMSQYPKGEILISSIEHPAVAVPASQYAHSTIRVNEKAEMDINDLKSKINDNVVLISIIYANNEVGTIQDLKKILEIIDTEKKQRKANSSSLPLILHTDASQIVNYKKIDLSRLKVDLMTISSAKIYGPKGVGCLFVSRDVKLIPQILGGGQEFNLRSGTENTASIVGFTNALLSTQERCKKESLRLQELKKYFISSLDAEFNEVIHMNSTSNKSIPNIINVSFRGFDGERLVMELDERGIMTSTGSACSANSSDESVTLSAMGLQKDMISGSLRFSMGRSTTKEYIDYTVKALTEIIT